VGLKLRGRVTKHAPFMGVTRGRNSKDKTALPATTDASKICLGLYEKKKRGQGQFPRAI